MSPSMQTFQKEKEAYWQMREELLKTHLHQWVAISGGVVVASSDSAEGALDLAYLRGGARALYLNKVGAEESVSRKKIRQVEATRYDMDYDPPMPMVSAEVTSPDATERTRVDLIFDTGADVSVLQEDVCAGLGLIDFPAEEAYVSGIGATWEPKTLYAAKINLVRRSVTMIVDCRDDVAENILGRNVMRHFSITFDGKRNRITITE